MARPAPTWDDGTPVPINPFARTTCDECGSQTTTYIVDDGAPADLENGPSAAEIPFVVCIDCFWSEDDAGPGDGYSVLDRLPALEAMSSAANDLVVFHDDPGMNGPEL